MKIDVIKEKRRTISLQLIDSEHAVLKVPTSLSQAKIDKFLESKANWLERHAKELWQKENFSKTFDFSKYLYVNGQSIGKTKDIMIDFDQLSVVEKKRAIKQYYISLFPQVELLAREIAKDNNLSFKELKPTAASTLWGSFSSKKVMKLHWSLVVLPLQLQKYVICHELAHSEHFNHSPKFWNLVEQLCPGYKTLRKELKNYSFLLNDDLNI